MNDNFAASLSRVTALPVLINVTISGNSGPATLSHLDRAITLSSVTLAQNTGQGLNLQGNPPLLLCNTLLNAY